MLGEFSLYASVTITPETTITLLECVNPLGVVPKLVRVKTTDRTTSTSCMWDLAVKPDSGVGIYSYQSSGNSKNRWSPSETQPTNPWLFHITDSVIEIQRGASSGGRWIAGATYTVHIYA